MRQNPRKKSRQALLIVVLALATLGVILFNTVVLNPPHQAPSEPPGENAAAQKELSLSLGANLPFITAQTIRAFEEAHPGIQVNVVVSTSSVEYQYTRYKTDFFSRADVADVMLIELTWLDEFASQGWLLPLANYYNDAYTSRFIPTVIDTCRYEGSLYSLPAMVDIPVLYYRSDLISRPPQSYEELVALAGDILPAQEIKYAYVGAAQAYDSLVCMAGEFLLSGGNALVSEGKVTLAAPDAQLGLDTMFSVLMSNPNPIDVFSFTEKDAQIAFAQGDALFMRNWLSAYKALDDIRSPVKGRFATVPLPVASAGQPGAAGAGTLSGWQYAISRSSKYPDEAALLIDFLVNEENQRRYCQDHGTPPTLLACYEDAALVSVFSDQADIAKAYESAWLRPKTPYYMEISTLIAPEFARFIRGYGDTGDTIEALRQILKRYFVLSEPPPEAGTPL